MDSLRLPLRGWTAMNEPIGPTTTWRTEPAGCGFRVGASWVEVCGRPAAAHAAVHAADEDGGVSMLNACADHRPYVGKLSTLIAIHDYASFCGLPGALWHWDLNMCLLDGSGQGPELVGVAVRETNQDTVEYPPFVYSRAVNGSRDFIATWPGRR